MSLEVFLAMTSFAFAAAMTPGPNNIMLTASGVNFGVARSVPHMLGVIVSFMVMLAAAGLGLGTLFVTVPALQTLLKVVGSAYLLWLAWKIGTATSVGTDGATSGRPMTFMQAALFQWVNPKAIMSTLSGVAVFVSADRLLLDLALVILMFTVATTIAVATWTAFGAALRQWLQDPRRVRAFNVVMALLLAASIVPMVWT